MVVDGRGRRPRQPLLIETATTTSKRPSNNVGGNERCTLIIFSKGQPISCNVTVTMPWEQFHVFSQKG